MGSVTPLAIGVVWTGYTLAWYGYSLLQGRGTGILDLIYPSRLPQMVAIMGQWHS